MGIHDIKANKHDPVALYDFDDKADNTPPEDPHAELHKQLMDWYHTEKDKQSVNRLQMQIDCDFYDNMQWSEEDAQALIERGQQPAVYNQVAPMVDWVVGTERRTRVDWNVLPRGEEDGDAAIVKNKLLKYVSDVNFVPFNRSKAFADCVKAGVGWLEDGITSDPEQEMLYSRYEDWRNVWWDSNAVEVDISDARYLWREKWLDADMAAAIFKGKESWIKQAVVGYHQMPFELEDQYYLGQSLTADAQERYLNINRYMNTTNATTLGRRERVKVMEFWYRKPEPCEVCHGIAFNGQEYDPNHAGMKQAVESGITSVIRHVKMCVYVAFITKDHVLSVMKSPYKHNRFPFTPIWCYKRKRDNLPYGVIRRVRDPQESLNKRMSKALWHLSARQVIADDTATDDWNELAQEVARPDGIIKKRRGSELVIQSGEQHAAAHIEYANLDAQIIQKSSGVTDENLGRQTNAKSGVAIEARQQQGAVVTTEIFDNLRLAIQMQGQVQLSMIEQFYSAPKIIRITDEKQAADFVKINQIEETPDGQIRFINDITATQADFIVSEADFHGSLRQAMFESMMSLTQSAQMAPEVALKLLRMAFEYSDFPNKDQIVAELRKMTGDVDPNEKMKPEEQQALMAQQQAAQQAQAMQQQLAQLQSEELAAKVQLAQAQAAKLMAEAQTMQTPDNSGVVRDEMQKQLQMIQEQSAKVLTQLQNENTQLNQQLAAVQLDFKNREMEISGKYNATVEAARINAEAQKEVGLAQAQAEARRAEIEASSNAQIDALNLQLKEMMGQMSLMQKAMADAEKKASDEVMRALDQIKKMEEAEAKRESDEKDEDKQPMVINVSVDAKPTQKKTVKFKRDKAGKVIGAEVEGEDE